MNKIIVIFILVFCSTACDFKNQLDVNNNDGNTVEIIENDVDSILYLPNSKDVIVLRTDFSSDSIWKNVCNVISESGKDLGFRPYVEFLNKNKYERMIEEELLNTTSNYKHSIIFIVDSIAIYNEEHPILCIDLYNKQNESFRVIPSEMWSVENNLSISNMDFVDFINAMDKDGIFRGFYINILKLLIIKR